MNNKNKNSPIPSFSEILQSPFLYFGISAAFIGYTPGKGIDPMVTAIALAGFMLWMSMLEWMMGIWIKYKQRRQSEKMRAELDQRIQKLEHDTALIRKDLEILRAQTDLLSSRVDNLQLRMHNLSLSLRCMWLESKLRRDKANRPALPDESNIVEGTTSWVDEDDPRNTMKNRTQEPPSLAS